MKLCFFLLVKLCIMYVYLFENGGKPATRANMGRRIRYTVDPNYKQGGRRAGGRPKQIKTGQNRRPFGRRFGVALRLHAGECGTPMLAFKRWMVR